MGIQFERRLVGAVERDNPPLVNNQREAFRSLSFFLSLHYIKLINNMKLIMENWRGYTKSYKSAEEIAARYLQDPEFCREVFGVQIPLNESYPYSVVLTEALLKRITQEQLLLEGWIADQWEKLKKVPGEIADFIRSLLNVIKGGRLDLFWRGLKKAGLNVIKGNLNKVFELIISRRGKYPGSEKFADWAQKGKDALDKASQALMGTVESAVNEISLEERPPPPVAAKIFGATVFLVGLKFAWNQIEDWAADLLTGAVDKIAMLQKVAGEILQSGVEKLLQYLATLGIVSLADGGATALATTLIEVGKWVGKGVSAVVGVLAPAFSFYKSRGGLNEAFI